MKLSHRFVTNIPDVLDDGVIYVSIDFATAIHKCCCGCGKEVVTPLSPSDWKLIFDGRTISLDPSIGNWSFPCQSHYWIRRNKVVWARRWSRQEIQKARERDLLGRRHFAREQVIADELAGDATSRTPKSGWWARLKSWWGADRRS